MDVLDLSSQLLNKFWINICINWKKNDFYFNRDYLRTKPLTLSDLKIYIRVFVRVDWSYVLTNLYVYMYPKKLVCTYNQSKETRFFLKGQENALIKDGFV